MTVQGNEFEFEIKASPTFSYLKVLLKQGQQIKTERGNMLAFEPTLEIQTKKAEKGFFKSLKRKFAGETFLMNYFHANHNGWLLLAPPFAGDLMHVPMNQGQSWIVFSGGYIASSTNLLQATGFQGFKKSFFSGENAFVLTITANEGPGDLFVGANGAFIEWNLEAGQILNCDNGHLVAMEASVHMDIKRVGGWKSTMMSGEGVICQLTGPGKVILQSRNPKEFAQWLFRMSPSSSSGGSGGASINLGSFMN
ncbi:TIGR00266 family protein [Candidatus Lokiarchaeum ossiferum]|uniref:TIGR00266 family protein n=1 Tax=Candidatus Lokiarchaeum ossiferum TaxID=2951803 RepID=UPI00352C7069